MTRDEALALPQFLADHLSMSGIERNPPGTGAAEREEQLNWLHIHSLQLEEQTRLLRRIARYTRLQYILTWICLGFLIVSGAVVAWRLLPSSAHPAVIFVAVLAAAGVLIAMLPSSREAEDEEETEETYS